MAPLSFLLHRLLALRSEIVLSLQSASGTGVGLHTDNRSLSAYEQETEQRLQLVDEEHVRKKGGSDNVKGQMRVLKKASSAGKQELGEERYALAECVKVVGLATTDCESEVPREKEKVEEGVRVVQAEAGKGQWEHAEEGNNLEEHMRTLKDSVVAEQELCRERDILMQQVRGLRGILVQTEQELADEKNALTEQVRGLQEGANRDIAALRSASVAVLNALRTELDAAQEQIAADKSTLIAVSEEKDFLEMWVAETQTEKVKLELRIEEVRRERETDLCEMERFMEDIQKMGQEQQEENERLCKRVEENEKLIANGKEIFSRKDRELAKVAAKALKLEESERRLQLEHEELLGEQAELIAEITPLREKAKKADKDVEECRTNCEQLRMEIETVRLEMTRAQTNHQDELAKKERELAQAVTNAVVLEGTGSFSIADLVNFDGAFSEVDSDHSTWHSSEGQTVSPQSVKGPTISSTSKSPQYSTFKMHTSSGPSESDVVYRQVAELESALEKEKRIVEVLRLQVTGLIQNVPWKEEESASLTNMSGKHHCCSRMNMRACPDVRAHQQEASPSSTAPTPTPPPVVRKRTKSVISPMRNQAEDSFRSLSRLIPKVDNDEKIGAANSEFNESYGDISSRNLTRTLAVGKRHGQTPHGATGNGTSVRLSPSEKKASKEESNTPLDVALRKVTRGAHSLKRLKATVGVNLSQRS